MKKLLFSALLTISVAISSFAASTNVNVSVLRNFKTEFVNAANVSWTSVGEYAKATFTVKDVKMEAFYNIHGDLVGTSRGVSLDELPIAAKRTFAKKYNGYTVKEVIYFQGSGESAYFLSAENGTESIIFKVGDDNHLSTYQKEKK